MCHVDLEETGTVRCLRFRLLLFLDIKWLTPPIIFVHWHRVSTQILYFWELEDLSWRRRGLRDTRLNTPVSDVGLTRLLLRPWLPAATGGEGCRGLGPVAAVGPAGQWRRQRWRRWSRRGAPLRQRDGWSRSQRTSLNHKRRSFSSFVIKTVMFTSLLFTVSFVYLAEKFKKRHVKNVKYSVTHRLRPLLGALERGYNTRGALPGMTWNNWFLIQTIFSHAYLCNPTLKIIAFLICYIGGVRLKILKKEMTFL